VTATQSGRAGGPDHHQSYLHTEEKEEKKEKKEDDSFT
jgi:hypothetical protein